MKKNNFLKTMMGVFLMVSAGGSALGRELDENFVCDQFAKYRYPSAANVMHAAKGEDINKLRNAIKKKFFEFLSEVKTPEELKEFRSILFREMSRNNISLKNKTLQQALNEMLLEYQRMHANQQEDEGLNLAELLPNEEIICSDTRSIWTQSQAQQPEKAYEEESLEEEKVDEEEKLMSADIVTESQPSVIEEMCSPQKRENQFFSQDQIQALEKFIQKNKPLLRLATEVQSLKESFEQNKPLFRLVNQAFGFDVVMQLLENFFFIVYSNAFIKSGFAQGDLDAQKIIELMSTQYPGLFQDLHARVRDFVAELSQASNGAQ